MKKYDFVVLGADGMQGRIVVRDLLENGYTVLACDIFKSKIADLLREYHKLSAFQFVDVKDVDRTTGVILKSKADIVINCAEADWNINVYQACLHAKCHVIDLGSRYVDTGPQLALDGEFRKIGKTAITGCGSVPGIGNVMLAYAARKFDSIETIEAGFAWDSKPQKFYPPFSLESILEEYTLPAVYIQNKRRRKIDPQASAKVRTFRTIGPQKIFLVDHSELYTFYHYFKSWGLKNIKFWGGFPEHSDRVLKTLVDLTFADKRALKLEKCEVKADEVLTQIGKRMKLPRGYKEWENLWVEVTGRVNRKKKKILMECLVPPVKGWEEAGCNIDTGFPASIIAQMIKYGDITRRGSFSPEIGVPIKEFFKELRKRKLRVYEDSAPIN